MTSMGYGLGESAVATAGAIAGGAKTTYRAAKSGVKWAGNQAENLAVGAKDAGSWLWDHTFGDSGPSDKELAASAAQMQSSFDAYMDKQMDAEEDRELYGPVTQEANEEMPPLPTKR